MAVGAFLDELLVGLEGGNKVLIAYISHVAMFYDGYCTSYLRMEGRRNVSAELLKLDRLNGNDMFVSLTSFLLN